MKTKISILLTFALVLVLLVLGLASCAPTTEEPAAPEPTEEVAAPEPTEEVAAPEPTEEPAAPEPTEPPPEPTEAPEKILVIAAQEQYSETFDISTMVYSDWPTEFIYDNLVSVDTNYDLVPGGLAEGWEVSEDGTVVTFFLKEGVTFHDGSDFNAGVVKWFLEEMVKEGACCAYMYNAITEIEIIRFALFAPTGIRKPPPLHSTFFAVRPDLRALASSTDSIRCSSPDCWSIGTM